jgi:hypothetical protein
MQLCACSAGSRRCRLEDGLRETIAWFRARLHLLSWGGPLWAAGLTLAAAALRRGAAVVVVEAVVLLGVLAVCRGAGRALSRWAWCWSSRPSPRKNIIAGRRAPRDSEPAVLRAAVVAWAGQIARRRARTSPTTPVLALLVRRLRRALAAAGALVRVRRARTDQWGEIALMRCSSPIRRATGAGWPGWWRCCCWQAWRRR